MTRGNIAAGTREHGSCCTCPGGRKPPAGPGSWQDGWLPTTAGPVVRVKTRLDVSDTLGGWRVRWGIGRDHYQVPPGLYAVGDPTPDSPVLVTANYKLTFDLVRRNLPGRDLWLLVVDSRGINVWCAAGKGHFSSAEVVKRVSDTRLAEVVRHRTLILPQLSASGVAAHEVKRDSGFSVLFGPVRAGDIGAFLDAGCRATPAMRTVTFPLAERLKIVPVELAFSLKYYLLFLLLATAGCLLFAPVFWSAWIRLTLPVLLAILTGTVLTAALLPWVPFRAFTLKGLVLGFPVTLAISLPLGLDRLQLAGNVLFLPVLTAFIALNLTGSSTFTSQTGVNREIRRYARPLAVIGLSGVALMLVSLWLT